MRTVKQVSDLTKISVRMLHHYDKIGLLKPSGYTKSGYRLYDDKALGTLQQILFFKELDLPLKEIKKIMTDPGFDKMQALKNQKKLLTLKKKKLNDLIGLIDKTLKGENAMSFKEFDMSEYFNALEEFKKEHEDKVIKYYGSVDKFNEHINLFKSKQDNIAKMAIKEYGSIEKYVSAMKKNLNNFDILFKKSEQSSEFRKDCLGDNPKLEKLFKSLVSDLSKDPASDEIQNIAQEITDIAKNDYEIFKVDIGDAYWFYFVRSCLLIPSWIKKVDSKYGTGASKFIGTALKYCLKGSKPKIEMLYQKLASDLNKDPHSDEIQKIVHEIEDENKRTNSILKVEEGENHLRCMADYYLSDSHPTFIKINDERYGTGASKFIGEALKFYSEHKKK